MGKPGRPAIERTGQRYGLVTVLARVGTGKDGCARWRVRCDCGLEREVAGKQLDDFPPSTHNACARIRRQTGAA